MKKDSVELLFGLDMLKKHQGVIDLKNNLLYLEGTSVAFLSEKDLPEHAKLSTFNDI